MALGGRSQEGYTKIPGMAGLTGMLKLCIVSSVMDCELWARVTQW